MKFLSALTSIIFLAGSTVLAGDLDFNAIISENTAAQKQLSHELQGQLKTKDLDRVENPNFRQVGEDVLGKDRAAENIAVDSQIPSAKHQIHRSGVDGDARNFKRISQELRDLK